jgi:hypothetical protein
MGRKVGVVLPSVIPPNKNARFTRLSPIGNKLSCKEKGERAASANRTYLKHPDIRQT